MSARITRTRRRSVSVSLLVSAEVVTGKVDEEQLLKWVVEAIVAYHRFRAGWVGIEARAGMRLPEVKMNGQDSQT